MSTPTRWGIVSAGRISHDFVAAVKLLPPEEHHVYAVAARELPRAQEFAKYFNIDKAYGSYEELAQDPNIDVIYVGTIPVQHLSVCKLMINAGKNVLCEKPLAVNSHQVNEILALAEAKGVFFMEAFWSRFFPAYAQLRTELEQGTIGDLKAVTVTFGKKHPADYKLIHTHELGGGALLSLGCYPLQLATLIFNEEPEKVVSVGKIDSNGTDEFESITLMYSNGRVVQTLSSKNCFLDNTAVLYGTKGSIHIPNFWRPDKLILPEKTYEFPAPHSSEPMNFSGSAGLLYEAQRVRECLLKGMTEDPLMPHAHSRIIVGIMDEVRRQIGLKYDADNE